ncbi:MAG: hypothetical protein KatS3mg014_0706 [Actinomycetota bacterium]|nr:MAG: hypothetical protein KatS3mg014_0706 [Actinomycetota bacterium]
MLGDGGYLLELEKRGYVQAGPFTPEVAIEHPEALAELHREFLRAGAEFLTTLTFYASEDKLATVGLADRVDEINRNAVRIAREGGGRGRRARGGGTSRSPGPTTRPTRRAADHVRALFDRQLRGHAGRGRGRPLGGGDVRLAGRGAAVRGAGEGDGAAGDGDDVLRARARARLEGGRTRPAECARRLADAGADVVGANCLNGARAQQLPIADGDDAGRRAAYVACQPVGVPDERRPMPDFTAWPEFPYATLAAAARPRRDGGVRAEGPGGRASNVIGSCCGSVAEHVRAMAKALGKLPAEERPWRSPTGRPMSGYEYHGHTETEI